MNEQWKDIAGYEGRYQISNKGRVKSLQKWNVSKRQFQSCEEILNPTDNGHGYLIVGLKNRGYRKSYYIHRLVAEAFIDNTNKAKVVNHKDFNKKNNDVDNLEWVTQKENVLYSLERMKKPHNVIKAKSGYKYIREKKRGYEVSIRNIYRGTFKTLEQALQVRDAAIIEEWGYI